jgi:hypothetical protein
MTKNSRAAGPVLYDLRLEASGTDGIRALRAALKLLWRRHQLRCVSAREVATVADPVPPGERKSA